FLPVDDLTQALAQALGHAIGLDLHLTRGHNAEGSIPRGRTVGVGVKRAAVRDALEAVALGITGLRHHLHDLIASSHSPTRQPAGENFGERAEIRDNAQLLLQTARTPAKARDHFVQNHHHAIALCQLTYTYDKARWQRHRAV